MIKYIHLNIIHQHFPTLARLKIIEAVLETSCWSSRPLSIMVTFLCSPYSRKICRPSSVMFGLSKISKWSRFCALNMNCSAASWDMFGMWFKLTWVRRGQCLPRARTVRSVRCEQPDRLRLSNTGNFWNIKPFFTTSTIVSLQQDHRICQEIVATLERWPLARGS